MNYRINPLGEQRRDDSRSGGKTEKRAEMKSETRGGGGWRG